MRRIAFFGGSFDPPHRGHLAVAKAAAEQFSLDEVLFAPVASQPLKMGEEATPFLHRYAMTVLATLADPRFIPSLVDAPQPDIASRPNYTVETLARLRRSFERETCLFVLLGADSWLEISRWHDAARLLALADWIVAARPGFSLASATDALPPEVTAEQIQDSTEHFLMLHHSDGSSTRVSFLPYMHEDVSARELRAALDNDEIDATWLTAEVRDYIRKAGLYGTGMG